MARLRRQWWRSLAAPIGLVLHLAPAPARAQTGVAELAPTTGAEASTDVERRGAGPASGQARRKAAKALDSFLAEALKDLGLSPRPAVATSRGRAESNAVIVARWRVFPQLSSYGGDRLKLRLSVIPPGSRVTLSRTRIVRPEELEVKAMVIMRDLIRFGEARSPRVKVVKKREINHADVPESEGRAVLALSSAVLGGYVGLSLQRASGSDDPRLIYPLTALGAGIGLGGSMIVADEWNIGIGDAWYLASGMLWPTLSGLTLAASYDVPVRERYVFGLVGAASGVTLATVALSRGRMSEGGALLAHSGGGFGMFLGGITQLAIEGTLEETPSRGMGFGAGIGVLSAGILATQVHPPASRVLLIDLGTSLGGLVGAAAASPALLVDDTSSERRERIWLFSIVAGTAGGAVLGFWLTKSGDTKASEPATTWATPYVEPCASPYGAVWAAPSGFAAGVRGGW